MRKRYIVELEIDADVVELIPGTHLAKMKEDLSRDLTILIREEQVGCRPKYTELRVVKILETTT